MPNDAKLGLVIGVGLVITVAVIFFRKDDLAAHPAPEPDAGAAQAVTSTSFPAVPRDQLRPTPARTAIRTAEGREPDAGAGRRHTVQAGETLFGLAQRYYGDGDRFVDLYRANRGVLRSPDGLPPGTVLIIPDLPAEQARAGDDRGR
jgi:nucleoid-associated protein YgaU